MVWQRNEILSSGASFLARVGLNVDVSGSYVWVICTPSVNRNISIDTKGYKILLEILVKIRNTNKEIPFTFIDRRLKEKDG